MFNIFRKMFSIFEEPRKGVMSYRLRPGNGKMTSVSVLDNGFGPSGLRVHFERQINSGDVKEGKLLPMSFEGIKRRGGKRSFTFHLSYEAAEDLNKLLVVALKDARKRQRRQAFNELLFCHIEMLNSRP